MRGKFNEMLGLAVRWILAQLIQSHSCRQGATLERVRNVGDAGVCSVCSYKIKLRGVSNGIIQIRERDGFLHAADAA